MLVHRQRGWPYSKPALVQGQGSRVCWLCYLAQRKGDTGTGLVACAVPQTSFTGETQNNYVHFRPRKMTHDV